MNQIEHKEIEKDLNILVLLSNEIIMRYENLENQKIVKFQLKNRGRAFVRELEKVSNVICQAGIETNKENYNEAINDIHKFSNRLNEFLDKMYNESIFGEDD